jgi:hypothetical protein
MPEIYRTARPTGGEADHDGGFRSVDEPTWNEIAREYKAASQRPSERERKFVSDMVRWTARDGNCSLLRWISAAAAVSTQLTLIPTEQKTAYPS